MEQQKRVRVNQLGKERHPLIHFVVLERAAKTRGVYSRICTCPMSRPRNKGYVP